MLTGRSKVRQTALISWPTIQIILLMRTGRWGPSRSIRRPKGGDESCQKDEVLFIFLSSSLVFYGGKSVSLSSSVVHFSLRIAM